MWCMCTCLSLQLNKLKMERFVRMTKYVSTSTVILNYTNILITIVRM